MEPNQQQISDALPVVRYEMEQLLSVHGFRARDKQEERVYLEAVLVHIRILVEFFHPSKRRFKDNILPRDFGFNGDPIDLPDTVTERIHKDLAHLTYSRLNRTGDNKLWCFRDIMPPVLDRCIGFINHVLQEPPGLADPSELQRWQVLLEKFETIQSQQ